MFINYYNLKNKGVYKNFFKYKFKEIIFKLLINIEFSNKYLLTI